MHEFVEEVGPGIFLFDLKGEGACVRRLEYAATLHGNLLTSLGCLEHTIVVTNRLFESKHFRAPVEENPIRRRIIKILR